MFIELITPTNDETRGWHTKVKAVQAAIVKHYQEKYAGETFTIRSLGKISDSLTDEIQSQCATQASDLQITHTEEQLLAAKCYASWCGLSVCRPEVESTLNSPTNHLLGINLGYSLFLRNCEYTDPIFNIVGYEANLGSNYPNVVIGINLTPDDISRLSQLRAEVFNIDVDTDESDYPFSEIDSCLTPEYIEDSQSKKIDSSHDRYPEGEEVILKFDYLDADTDEPIFSDNITLEYKGLELPVRGKDDPVPTEELKVGDVIISTRDTGNSVLMTYAKITEISTLSEVQDHKVTDIALSEGYFKVTGTDDSGKEVSMLTSIADLLVIEETGETTNFGGFNAQHVRDNTVKGDFTVRILDKTIKLSSITPITPRKPSEVYVNYKYTGDNGEVYTASSRLDAADKLTEYDITTHEEIGETSVDLDDFGNYLEKGDVVALEVMVKGEEWERVERKVTIKNVTRVLPKQYDPKMTLTLKSNESMVSQVEVSPTDLTLTGSRNSNETVLLMCQYRYISVGDVLHFPTDGGLFRKALVTEIA